MKIKNYLLIGYAGWDDWDGDEDNNIKERVAFSDSFPKEEILKMAHENYQKRHRVTSFRLEELPDEN